MHLRQVLPSLASPRVMLMSLCCGSGFLEHKCRVGNSYRARMLMCAKDVLCNCIKRDLGTCMRPLGLNGLFCM
ncbi:hypothetical protein BKA66DRAFT_86797 [Pyrenochaeta sp. MPI-SDFR-AT-0127]|nr:hypothetical protein BKA66DRAFT_86797 [Pyrenochaeta sp. MPI-SDFR-AT-0127]